MKTRILSIFTLLIICMGVNAQNVNIPDANFKTYLVNNHTINTNQDTEIQVSEATAFAGSIDCGNKSISDLTGIEEFPNIVELICDRNNLTTINISNNTALTLLNVDRNSLTNLDASANAALYHLYAQRNQLSTISTNSALAGGLYLAYNNFTTLDLSNNPNLTELSIHTNALTTLDVSTNSRLFGLYCQDNALISLNVANGSNTGMGFNAQNNPNLTCIEVDNVAWSTANWTRIDATASFSTNCPAPTCTVNIPDANFKAYLVGNTSINTNNDAEIQCSEATAFTGLINCASLSISDLTGIEAFINITDLLCNNNNLTSIDISAIPNLGGLDCSDNQLTSLNTSLNTSLYNIRCANNALTSIDLSTHPYINTLYCNGNNITTLNLSNLTTLNDLNCSNNQITSIDTSNIPLQYFECQNNALTSLNVANGNNYNIVDFDATNNPNLTCIQVDDVAYSNSNWSLIDSASSFSTNCAAQQHTLTINATNGSVTTNPNPTSGTYNDGTVLALTATPASGYQFTGWSGAATGTTNPVNVTMDADKTVTANFSLITVVQRTLTINATNGTVTTNPNPTNGTYANGTVVALTATPASGYQFTGWSGAATGTTNPVNVTMDADKTVTANFSLITVVQRTLTINATNGTVTTNPNPTSGTYADGTVVALTAVPASGYQFTGWSGAVTGTTNPVNVTMDADKTVTANFSIIQSFVYIPDANFKAYLVGSSSINTNGDTEIQFSEAAAFPGTININSLGVANLTGIEAFTSLTKLYAQNNQLTNVDVSANTALTNLTCQNNQLTSLDLSVNTALTYLNYSNNQITNLNLLNNVALEYLFCNNNQITSLDLSSNTVLVKLSCTTNLLMSLDVSANTALSDLNCSVNQLTTLDVSANTALTKLYCVDNQITSLDLAGHTLLESLFCENNQLTSLNVANGNNSNFVNFNSTMNSGLTCIQVDDVAWSNTNWASSKDALASFSTNCVVQQYTLTINATNGTVTTNPNPTNGTYTNGTVVTLTATPNTGYAFVGWSGAATGATNPLNITMDANKTITAVFTSTAIQRTLTINTTNGVVTTNPNPTSGTYNNGTVVTLTAIPNTGYAFTGWSGAVSGSTNSVNVTMNANKTVTATFSLTTTSTWIGNTTLWGTASNWTNGVPTALSDAIIPSGLSIYPTASNAVTFNSLTIESGGSFIAQSTVTGNVTYNRTVTSDWHLLASPVIGQDIAAIKNDVAVNGVKYAVAPYDNTQSSPLLSYHYFTTASGTNDINTAGNFEAAKGYSVKKITAGDISFTGTVNTADVPMAITDNGSTGGNNWNLVGNPFTASLNGNIDANTTNNFLSVNANELDPARVAVYLWDAATSSYNIMNQTTTGRKYIAPGQGFFVASKNTGGTLQFTEAMQTHQTGNIFSRTSNNTVPSIELFVSNGSSQKTTSVKYYNTATIGLDPGYDAGIFSGEAQEFNVYTELLSNDSVVDFGIQSLPTNNYDAMVIPLGVNAVANSTLSFTIDAQNLPAGIKVYLEDRLENTFTELNTTQENYMVTISNALNGSGRFYIHTTSSVLGVDNDIAALNSIYIYKSSKKTLTITGLENQEGNNVKIYNAVGKQVLNRSIKSQQKIIVQLPISLSTGMYIVKLQTTNGSINKKVFID